ncbi:hypothetical protein [Marinibactrum halimedae]|uniref:VCBS repeat-containing protein n=1 Tax=Marinibactrum halimedae TaxID=1444977 RepID=A0AA37T0A4_9GAMM|nr:hypothetical protein [Marinibactrum halimedae]MCD9460925.1 hypothetical protein [Marinibactrum halimedae]GLS24599.1 hypothetical protein GCM10007877_03130 [Marinibactrum halimedae]
MLSTFASSFFSASSRSETSLSFRQNSAPPQPDTDALALSRSQPSIEREPQEAVRPVEPRGRDEAGSGNRERRGLDFSEEGLALAQRALERPVATTNDDTNEQGPFGDLDGVPPEMMTMFRMIQEISGEISTSPFDESDFSFEFSFSRSMSYSSSFAFSNAGNGQGALLSMEQSSSVELSVSASFSLGDETFSFDFTESRSQSFSAEIALSQSTAPQSSPARRELIDPLVLNFGEPLSFTDQRTLFDLDADGQEESIPLIGENSYFLALDRNGNNEIDDGSELFGPATGNGFEELALFDQYSFGGNGNGLIDIGDSIFNQLSLFRPDTFVSDFINADNVENDSDNTQQNNGNLISGISLQQAGVSFIYLAAEQASFEYVDEDNNLLARAAYESTYGGAVSGSIQHIDIAV